ncbi:MAG: hypothetical protein B6D57_03780 [Candidatus Coatesbacteria bacterium 4484_99]|uniref:Uncharacterized protein n=1 Tax=Candidatus Coatesbacteria bacterium 4484_99 TaxID=1970774 RepID=A0A1W9S0K7_9BACT|nr:MAG: hypothetical protein B6D57_03780 [Candidatus Coatesbacteria bacterium 4484_99]
MPIIIFATHICGADYLLGGEVDGYHAVCDNGVCTNLGALHSEVAEDSEGGECVRKEARHSKGKVNGASHLHRSAHRLINGDKTPYWSYPDRKPFSYPYDVIDVD